MDESTRYAELDAEVAELDAEAQADADAEAQAEAEAAAAEAAAPVKEKPVKKYKPVGIQFTQLERETLQTIAAMDGAKTAVSIKDVTGGDFRKSAVISTLGKKDAIIKTTEGKTNFVKLTKTGVKIAAEPIPA